MKTKLLLLIVTLFFMMHGNAQSVPDASEKKDQEKVESAIIAWADTTFKDYNEPRFEKFRANYTDEYLIASMRVKSIDRRMSKLRKEYTMDKYKGTEKEFTKAMEDLKKRRKEAEAKNEDFRPKVTNYTIHFWANIKLDSGVHNYVEHKMVLNDDYKVVKSSIVGSIGDNEDANILYR
ncbi:MAG: hypothetical protein ACQERC_07300 [Bacteroidota bacterium]